MTAIVTIPRAMVTYRLVDGSVCLRRDNGPIGRSLMSLVGRFHNLFRIRLGRQLPEALPDSIKDEPEAFSAFATFEIASRLYVKPNGGNRKSERPPVLQPTLNPDEIWGQVQAGQGGNLLRTLLDGSLSPADRYALAGQLLTVLKAHWNEIRQKDQGPTFYRGRAVVTFSLDDNGVVEVQFLNMSPSPTIRAWTRLYERELRAALQPVEKKSH